MRIFILIILIFIITTSIFYINSKVTSQSKIEIFGFGPLYNDVCLPNDVGLDGENRVYIADPGYPYIKVFDNEGKFLYNFGNFGKKEGLLTLPFAIDVDKYNGRVALIDLKNWFIDKINRVQIFNLRGEFLFELKEFRYKVFGINDAIEFDKDGNIYVLTDSDKVVKIFNKEGKFLKEIIDKKDVMGFRDFAYNPKNNQIYIISTPQITNQKVHIFNINGDYITSFTKSNFYWPSGIDIDENGIVYITNYGLGTIEIFDSLGKFIKTISGQNIVSGYIMRPGRLSVANGRIAITDSFNSRVIVISYDGKLIHQIGTPKNQIDLFLSPTDVEVDIKENIYIVDFNKMKVSVFNKELKPGFSFGGFSETNKIGSLLWPWSIYYSTDNSLYITNRYYLGDFGMIRKFNTKGDELMRFGSPGNSQNQYSNPSGICADKIGNLYIADYRNSRVQKIKASGEFIKIFELKNETFNPIDVAVDSNFNLYVCDLINSRILVFDKDGNHIKTLHENAVSIYIDNLDRIWITNPDIDKVPIRVINTNGNLIKEFGMIGGPITLREGLKNINDYQKLPQEFFLPSGLVVKNDFLYIVDSGNKRVKKIPLNMIFQNLNIDIISPKDNEVIYDDFIKFSWNIKEDFGNIFFEFEISEDENFNKIIYKEKISNIKYIELNLKDINFIKNKIYYFRIRGVNDLSYGDWSKVQKFKFEDIIPPKVPDLFNAFKKDNLIRLEWSNASEGTFPILGYEIYKGEDPTKMYLLKVLNKEETFYLDSDFEYNKTYYYSIRVFDNYEKRNYSDFSKVISIIIEDLKPPEIFVNIPSETNESELTIEGKVVDDLSGIKDNAIYINKKRIDLDEENKFKYKLFLYEGINEINIEIIDNALNKLTKQYKVKYSKKFVIILQISSSVIYINDIPQNIDVAPQIIEGRTYLPIRYVVEPIGAKVDWFANEKKVTISLKETKIELWIGKNKSLVNGLEKQIDQSNPKVVPLIINGRTMLPLRFIAESLGCKVEWDGVYKKITVTYPYP
ncbi:MAG: stalk domain-containing protein [Caldisericia bacterium]|nr:stalk domain-containing protein [Caldisericia bacterium]